VNNPVRIDIGEAFGFAFKDHKWVTKILIGGLLLLVPFIGTFLASGYTIATARHVVDRHPSPLPEWDNFGDLLKRGFFSIVIGFVYALLLLLPAIGFAVITGIVGSVGGGSDAVAGLILLLTLVFLLVMLAATVLVAAMSYAALVRYIQTDSLGDAFQFGVVLEMVRARPATWLWLFVVQLLTVVVASLGLIPCGLGIPFTAVYAQAAFGHALGQVAAQLSTAGAHDFGQNQFDPSM